MAQLVGLIVSEDDAFKKHFGRLLRAGAIPVSVIDERAARESSSPDLVIVDTRGDASSSMSSIERLRAGAAGAGIFAVAMAADPDLILQSMRAGANEFFTWPPDEETFHGAVRRTAGAPRDGAGRAAVGDDAGVLRRQGRRRHDHGVGELRRRAGAAQQTIDGDRRSRSRGSARSRCSSACGRATACSTPSTTCTGSIASSCASWWSSTSPVWRFWPARISSIGRAPQTAGRSRNCSDFLRGSTSTSWSTPAARSIRARWRRSTPPTRFSWSPTRTSRRSAIRSGCSIASASSAPAASASACCSTGPRSRIRFRRSRSRARSATRFTTPFRATTRRCRRRSIRACRWR